MAARPLSNDDRWAFNGGTHTSAYDVLGAHLDGDGVVFRVWAPAAARVEIIGDFDAWGGGTDLSPDASGIWEGRVPGIGVGERYKYRITGRSGSVVDKADPYAVRTEEPPATASVVWNLAYEWSDGEWMGARGERNALDAPISIYEVHLGSWRYEPGGYRALAHQLAEHLTVTGFTHIELLPVMEHPFYGSWGYQTTGYFAPTARYGTPQDLMYLVDYLHQHGIGVILDWVPSHFPQDEHGLGRFDGTHLYEHADPRLGYHPDWDSLIFNYDRYEVRSFLLSSALFWLDRYHADGIRVDAVASMLYRDYSRRDGEWLPNEFGGRENLGAISLLRLINRAVYARHPDVQMFAEESTSFPAVTRPTDQGGLGFGEKWDMGWMNDTLTYVGRNPEHRKHHHQELTFRSLYAFTENFTLPLSHDEVVYGKGSLLAKQPGDGWQKLAGLRLLFGYQFAEPGKKLIFMGGEIAVPGEWDHEAELDWGVLAEPGPAGVMAWIGAINRLYRDQPALHLRDHDAAGFQWVVGDDADNSVYAFLRWGPSPAPILVVLNFTPVVRDGYRLGVPVGGTWEEMLNSDLTAFGGSGVGNPSPIPAEPVAAHGFSHSIRITLPPLAVLFLAPGDATSM